MFGKQYDCSVRPLKSVSWQLSKYVCNQTNYSQEPLEDGEILKSVTHWIERYLQKTEPLESQWWEMYLDEREFWNELPVLVEGLIRRT
jgi:hypothetical protein